MLQRAIAWMKREWLVALGIIAVILGGLVDILDQLDAIDISPVINAVVREDHAALALALLGVFKIVLRVTYGGISWLLVRYKGQEDE